MSWGSRPAPLLPETLRQAWADERLPAWVCTALGLPQGSTCTALDQAVWKTSTSAPTRILAFVANLVTARRSGIGNLNAFREPLPAELQFDSLPLSNRVKNSLKKHGLFTRPDRVSDLNYGHLLSLDALGVRSMLDLTCTIEAFRSSAIPETADGLTESDYRTATLLEFVDETEAGQISARDARFTDILGAIPGTIADYLGVGLSSGLDDSAHALSGSVLNLLRERVQSLKALSLDISLSQFVAQTVRGDDRKVGALCARLGFGGSPPVTLEEAGRMIGVTRERLRQIESKLRKRLPDHDLFVPKLDDAIDLLSRSTPISSNDAARLMVDSGLCAKPFSPESLMSAAELGGRTVDFTIESLSGSPWVTRKGAIRDARVISSIAKRQAQASGASNVQELLEELKVRKKIEATSETVRSVIGSVGGFAFLEDDWFWFKTGRYGRNRLRNVARKILSVAAPVEVSAIREGVRRVCRGHGSRGISEWPLIVPPRSVLKAFLLAHPDFEVDDEGLVTPAKALDYRVELTRTEETLVDVLRSTSSCVLDRTTFARRCVERGMNIHTFSQYLSFSPVINHLGTDLWSLRGVRVDPAAVEVLRQTNATRPSEKRIIDYGWSENGLLCIAVRVPEFIHSVVALIPSGVRRFVMNREFFGQDETGNRAGTIRVNQDGVCYGFGSYLGRRGADAGDMLILRFDITAGTVDLQLTDDELLESASTALV